MYKLQVLEPERNVHADEESIFSARDADSFGLRLLMHQFINW